MSKKDEEFTEQEFTEAFAQAVEEQNAQFQEFLNDPMGASVWDGIMKHFDPSYDPAQREVFAAEKAKEAEKLTKALRTEDWSELE